MSDIELERFKAMLREESIDDLLTALAYKIPLHRLDPLIIRGRTEHITNSELIESFDRLYKAGILMDGEDGGVVKGPKWVEPEFVKTEKYFPHPR
ncbi:hypothetical protein AB9C65_21100 [Klebsiella pasteurii]|uniref:hypothetical protein n=1 Tax=Klebsiella/Raoultella group TaxID=2890311 RepID=UPI0006669F53|nr:MULTISPECIES: hypothetical protein [Klebsiella/Raoultella group]GJK98784.1 hypothetical protein TUM17569_42450 [Klebsiella oxytoca]HCB9329003.1 hypothetical protein [Klebsiella variicola]AOO57157.1 hypothetical protein AN237_11790 [Raoultella ornithinolytica]MDH0813214.1 hypothetical protein [Klebsiella grimontii]MDH2043436.1 hypothetical protein [Klebsiella grimontii]